MVNEAVTQNTKLVRVVSDMLIWRLNKPREEEPVMNEYLDGDITRRNLLKLSTASAAAGVAGTLALNVSSAQAAPSSARSGARYLLDCHIHVGGSPALSALADQVHTPRDYLALRGKQPVVFAEAASQAQADNSDSLIATMDKNGVTHGIIQPTPGNNATNERIAEVAKRNKGRLFPLYRPEALLGNLGTGTMQSPDKAQLRQNTLQVVDEIENVFPKLGMFGMGELVVGGFVSTALDPLEITRDMAPIMEALRPGKLPIMLPTGSSGFKGGMYYVYQPIWV
ncbi:MAG: twin-arginine translocation signal domain-containing protein, partial [Halioglobus sp.]